MITQDDARQKQIASVCGLTHNAKSRIAEDAFDALGRAFEIKSVTKDKGVSTSRQVHRPKINKWRSQYWIIAKGPKTEDGMEIRECFIAHPEDLEPFFSACERKIDRYKSECDAVLAAAARQGITPDIIARVRQVIEVGTRLDDPTIPWRLVKTLTPIPLDAIEHASRVIQDFVCRRPLGGRDAI